MKALSCTASGREREPALYFGIMVLLLLYVQISHAQTNLVSRPVGIIRIDVPAGEQKLVSIPFRPFDSSINAVLQGQLSGANTEGASDTVYKWDPKKPGYVQALKADGTGNPEIDGKWFKDFTDLEQSDMTLEPGEGFFICNKQGAGQTVILAGEVVLDDENAMMLYPALNLVGYPYSTEGSAPEGHAVTEHGSGNDSDAMKMGKGYWQSSGDVVFWTEAAPYSTDIFPEGNGPPEILGIAATDDGQSITLSIACKGNRQERLDIYYQDIAEEEQFDTMSGWLVAQQGINPAGRDLIKWTDSGGRERPAVNQVFARYYMAADASIDSNENGDPDSREIFLDENSALAETFRGSGRNSGNHGDSTVTRNPLDPHVSTGRIMYVDQTIGRDLLTGRSPIVVGNDGPKKTIRAGLRDAAEGDQMIVKGGRYRETMDLAGKDITVTFQGLVDLSHNGARGDRGNQTPPLNVVLKNKEKK